MSASSLELKRIDDPRDSLDKARRKELERFAATHGVKEVVPGMPAILMRRILRSHGLSNIQIPKRTLGAPEPGSAPPGHDPRVTNDGVSIADVAAQGGEAVDAGDDLMRQWVGQEKQKPTHLPGHAINELRAQCRERGIALARTDTMASLKEKLDAKDAAERGQ